MENKINTINEQIKNDLILCNYMGVETIIDSHPYKKNELLLYSTEEEHLDEYSNPSPVRYRESLDWLITVIEKLKGEKSINKENFNLDIFDIKKIYSFAIDCIEGLNSNQISEDGFIIKKNDKYYKVSENFVLYKFVKKDENIEINKTFKKLKNAKKYIKSNL